jgi:signal transduction histidine kinase
LLRVATLVAQGGRPADVFAAVSEEADGLFGAGAAVLRFEYDGPAVVFVGISKTVEIPIGTRWEFRTGMASAEVYRTGRSARVDAMDWSSTGAPVNPGGRAPSSLGPRFGSEAERPCRCAGMTARTSDRDAEEQAALRRVATLVARATPPEDVFSAVAAEVGRLLKADLTSVGRADPGGVVTAVGVWSSAGDVPRTRRWPGAGQRGERRVAGAPNVATALANAEAQAALIESRARIVAAADIARRRIERDLHDGAQQRLVSLALQLRGRAQASRRPEAGELAAQMDAVADGLTGVLDELREIARGLHPAALAEGGLRPALKTLARRSAVPVRLEVGVRGRLPEPVELAAYYVVAEALTNAAKHAGASVVDVQVFADGGMLQVRVRDDGRGGADLTRGTGLVGLTDRVEALGGRFGLHSPPRAGTTVEAFLPLARLPLGAPVASPRSGDDPGGGLPAEPERFGASRGS